MSKKEYLDRHGNPIDVYTYPEGADHQALRDYQHAVEVAHERDGLPVEWFLQTDKRWERITPHVFFWGNGFRYRIAAPKIAKGHNPDNLTEEQVDVSEGWRLLEPEEVENKNVSKRGLQYWNFYYLAWYVIDYEGSFCSASTYRTKQPPGYFLPRKQETDEEAIERIWRKHSHNYGNDFRDGLREILEWERERVRNGGNK